MDKKKKKGNYFDIIFITSLKLYILYKSTNYLLMKIFFKNTMDLAKNQLNNHRPLS